MMCQTVTYDPLPVLPVVSLLAFSLDGATICNKCDEGHRGNSSRFCMTNSISYGIDN